MPRDEKNLVTNENETIKNKMKEKFAGTYPFPRDMDFQNEGEAYATWETLGFSPSAQKYFEQDSQFLNVSLFECENIDGDKKINFFFRHTGAENFREAAFEKVVSTPGLNDVKIKHGPDGDKNIYYTLNYTYNGQSESMKLRLNKAQDDDYYIFQKINPNQKENKAVICSQSVAENFWQLFTSISAYVDLNSLNLPRDFLL